jgi:hypothetical protein
MSFNLLASRLQKTIVVLILFSSQVLSVSLEVKLKSSQQFKKVRFHKAEQNFLVILTASGVDSIDWDNVQGVRIKKTNDFHPIKKTFLCFGYFTFFYFLLETMYTEAPFSVPQFLGVFTVFAGSGVAGGYAYAKLLERNKDDYLFVEFDKQNKNGKFQKALDFLISNKKYQVK